MPKNRQLNLIVSVKTPNIGFINKDMKNSGIKAGSYSVLITYQSLLSNIFSLALPSPLINFLHKI